MFGLDETIAGGADGASIWIVLAVAVLLGLRHATDPDHLAAVTTLVAGEKERAARTAGALGLAWGVGHATTLLAFGLPILLLHRYLPERVQQGAETAVGLVIAYLAVRLLVRWHRGTLHVHPHPQAHGARTRAGAFAIGLMHGMGGSAGVGVLLVASIQAPVVATGALLLLAVFTAVSMSILSTGFGLLLGAGPCRGRLARSPRLSAAGVSPSGCGTPPPRGASLRTRCRRSDSRSTERIYEPWPIGCSAR